MRAAQRKRNGRRAFSIAVQIRVARGRDGSERDNGQPNEGTSRELNRENGNIFGNGRGSIIAQIEPGNGWSEGSAGVGSPRLKMGNGFYRTAGSWRYFGKYEAFPGIPPLVRPLPFATCREPLRGHILVCLRHFSRKLLPQAVLERANNAELPARHAFIISAGLRDWGKRLDSPASLSRILVTRRSFAKSRPEPTDRSPGLNPFDAVPEHESELKFDVASL